MGISTPAVRHRRLVIVLGSAAVAVGLFVATGCGSNPSTSSSGATTSSAASSAASTPSSSASSAASSLTSASPASSAGGSASGATSGSASAATSGAASDAALDVYRTNGLKLDYITNPPLSGSDPATGKATGAGPIVMTKILNNLGITKLTFTNVPFASEIPDITSGKADLTANNFNNNAARCAQVGFTNPVALYHQGALVAKGNPKNLHSYDDIAKDSSVKIAMIRGDASLAWLQSYGVPTSRILQFDALPQAVTAVNQGRADVYLNAVVQLNLELKESIASGLELATPFKGPVIDGAEVITNASYAIPYKDVDLLNAINQQIAAMIRSGEMAQLLAPYGYPADSIPAPTLTAKSICPKGPWPASYIDLGSGS